MVARIWPLAVLCLLCLIPHATSEVQPRSEGRQLRARVRAPGGPPPPPSCTQFTDVWVLAGQSNMVGVNAMSDGDQNPNMPVNAEPMPGLVQEFTLDGTWMDAQEDVTAAAGAYPQQAALNQSSGPELCFARAMLSIGMSTAIGLVPTARVATSLQRDWAVGGLLYNRMISQTLAALAPSADGPQCKRLAGLIWVQGENDALVATGLKNSAIYCDNFQSFLSAARLALDAPALPVIMGIMSAYRRNVTYPYISTVRQQQLACPLDNVVKVDMQGFEFYLNAQQQLVHLTKAGQCAIGTAMAGQWLISFW